MLDDRVIQDFAQRPVPETFTAHRLRSTSWTRGRQGWPRSTVGSRTGFRKRRPRLRLGRPSDPLRRHRSQRRDVLALGR